MVQTDMGQDMMLRALLDSGYSKSIILKCFTTPKNREKLKEKDQI